MHAISERSVDKSNIIQCTIEGLKEKWRKKLKDWKKMKKKTSSQHVLVRLLSVFSKRQEDISHGLPKAMMSHQSQEFSLEARSVECFTIRVHLVKERPKPESAPYRDAIVWQKHMSSRKPIQLNRNATGTSLQLFYFYFLICIQCSCICIWPGSL